MEVSEEFIFYSLVVSLLVYYFWDVYLSFRQLKTYLNTTQIPTELIGILPQKTFDKARQYAIDKRQYRMVRSIYECAVSLVFLKIEYLPYLWKFACKTMERAGYEPFELFQYYIFMLTLNAAYMITRLPSGIYYHFILEQKHGFNNLTIMFYFYDRIKKFAMEQAVVIPIMCSIAYIIKKGGDFFFIYAWFFIIFAIFFGYLMYFDVILSLLDKFTPLPDSDLKNEIEKLASSVGFPLCEIFVVHSSRRTGHSNAYFMGLFNKKRIVLCDTLVSHLLPDNAKSASQIKIGSEEEEEKKKAIEDEEPNEGNTKEKKVLDINEILAILAHELGHWKLNHLLKRICFLLANALVVFFIFSKVFYYQGFYRAFGFQDTMPIVAGLMIVFQLVCLPYYELLSYSLAYLCRRFEFQSDRFAKSIGKSHFLKCALIKLNMNNLGFPVYDPLFSALRLTHPPLLERLRALDKND